MTTNELKSQLLQEHKRDKNLTLLGFGLITIVLILIYVFASKYIMQIVSSFSTAFDNTQDGYGIYYKFAFIAVFCGYLLYPVYKLYKLSKRPKKIDAFKPSNSPYPGIMQGLLDPKRSN